jgi:predicted acylesterase/phospholipase RssA
VTKRSLFMAGGGLKSAYQAGVLQVWLDEIHVEFDHADGVSSGVFNLAMWCQGRTGREISDSWRVFRPLSALSVDVGQLLRLPVARSILTYDRFRKNILPGWQLDWGAIRSTHRRATFNVFNFSEQRLEVIPAERMTEEWLFAAVALPTWFPPVVVDGQVYVDAVHATGANLEHAIADGAEELWIIWTISTEGRWRGGLVNQYFQVFEECTNSRFRATLAGVEESNRLHAAGLPSRYGRHIEVKLLAAEVPLQYLFNFRQSRFRRAVDLGAEHARQWCRGEGLIA